MAEVPFNGSSLTAYPNSQGPEGSVNDNNQENPPDTGEPYPGVLQEAHERYMNTLSAENENRQTFRESVSFVWGDQWDARLRSERDRDARPVLTNNQLGQFRNQVVNDIRQNKPAIAVHPASDEATDDMAQIIQGLIMNIERQSDAQSAYIKGIENAVDGGVGYWRICSRFENSNSFNQELYIQQIENSMAVFYDPNTIEPDYSDAQFCFVAEQMYKVDFKREFPNASMIDWEGSVDDFDFNTEDKILVCDYFRIVTKKKTLVKTLDGKIMFKEDMKIPSNQGMPEGQKPIKINDLIAKGPDGKNIERETDVKSVEWYKMTGREILEQYEWPGKYIPIIKIAGVERFVDGTRLTKGLVTDGLDAQRMYNYWITAATEQIALQSKSPYIMVEGQDEGHEQEWLNANIENIPVLKYKQTDVNGQQAPAPQRNPFAGVPTGIVEMAALCKQDLKSTMGIYDPSLGAHSNETSGRAILAKERQSDVATFHFVDNMNKGIAYTGRQIVDLFPHYYDTERVLRILGEDGEQKKVTINQQVAQPHPTTGELVTTILNDASLGEYDVTCQTGPNYGTKRIEAANSMAQFMQSYPPAAALIGDLYAKTQDWPESERIADRLKVMLPPAIQAAEQGQTPIPPQVMQRMQQMQQQSQQMSQHLQQVLQKLQELTQENSILKVQVQNKQSDFAARVQSDEYRLQAAQVNADAKKHDTDINAILDHMKQTQNEYKMVLDFIAKIMPQLAIAPQNVMTDVAQAVPTVESLQ